MSDIFTMLADPGRRLILSSLRVQERTVGELVALLDISQPGVSKQLRLMREAGLLRVRQDGQRRLYSIEPQPLIALDQWLQPYREFWNDRLDQLERHLDREV